MTSCQQSDPSSTPDVGQDLRIACLIPSATLICLELGLKEYLVGVTHECVEFLEEDFQSSSNTIRVLTRNGLPEDAAQGQIHQAVQDAASAAVCTKDGRAGTYTQDVPSLYPLIVEEMEMARPTVIVTQDLCSVCAPTQSQVQEALKKATADKSKEAAVQIISLQPNTLDEVSQSFVTIARACGMESIGIAKRNVWLNSFQKLQTVVTQRRDPNQPIPRMLILEWLDPPFDSGHWTYQMMEYAGIQMAKPKTATKSIQTTWEDIYAIDPSVVVIGCCGFDLQRNLDDALKHANELSKLTSAAQGNRIFACNGNVYIAMPGPGLFEGAVALAQCAYQDQPDVINEIQELAASMDRFPSTLEWERVSLDKGQPKQHTAVPVSAIIPDIEDLGDTPGFGKLHQDACEQGKLTYVDPASGYSVFTELAHKQRGYCCGSGCRHCPYSHENVTDKATRIQQPSVLHKTSPTTSLFSLKDNDEIKVMMHSGGKDSFLTIRQLVKDTEQGPPFGLVLMTTFDATSRVIAHQNVSIDNIIRQAAHLDITLVGIPMRRASGEPYVDRISRGLEVVKGMLSSNQKITSLLAGDLHLEHIREWREKTFGSFDFALEYPLWKMNYSDLMDDLEASEVPCQVSGSTVSDVDVGTLFTREFYDKLIERGTIDGFGECGEFHSLAKVWEVPRELALGCKK